MRHRPLMFAGRIHGFEDGEGGDGKGRRDAMGGFNAAGCGCKGWRNENCTVHTATLSRNLPACVQTGRGGGAVARTSLPAPLHHHRSERLERLVSATVLPPSTLCSTIRYTVWPCTL